MNGAAVAAACVWLLATATAGAQSTLRGEAIRISRAPARISIDGDISDEGWRGATRVEKWYETNPGDNNEPKVRNVVWIAYDDDALYAAFQFEDPNPGAMRAPYADRRRARGPAAVQGPGLTRQKHLHVQRADVRPGDRAIRLDAQ